MSTLEQAHFTFKSNRNTPTDALNLLLLELLQASIKLPSNGSLLETYQTLVVFLDVFKCRFQSNLLSSLQDYLYSLMPSLFTFQMGHPVSRKSMELIYRMHQSPRCTSSSKEHIYLGLLNFLKFYQKNASLNWWIYTLSDYTEFCLDPGSLDKQSLRYFALICLDIALDDQDSLKPIFNLLTGCIL